MTTNKILLGGPRPTPPILEETKARRGYPDLVLVSCTKAKHPTSCSAKDLYERSAWFRAARRYAEATQSPWFILSAKYGVLLPDEMVSSYELTLKRMSPTERKSWALRVVKRLDILLPRSGQVQLLAGRSYRDCLVPLLLERGWLVETPLASVPGLGKQQRALRALEEALPKPENEL